MYLDEKNPKESMNQPMLDDQEKGEGGEQLTNDNRFSTNYSGINDNPRENASEASNGPFEKAKDAED